MLKKLQIYNMPVFRPSDEVRNTCFVMTTCIRTLIATLDPIDNFSCEKVEKKDGDEAYGYLLEVVTGLKSQVLGETEIVSQFKQALKEYLKLENKNSKLVTILEKVLKDNKDIRSNHLKNVGQQSYSGITKNILKHKAKNNNVLIIGSGNLCLGLLKLLSKNYKIHLTARNSSKLMELQKHHNVKLITWQDKIAWKNFPNIVCTVGAYTTLLDNSFFTEWKKLHKDQTLFIDLGSPSTIKTELGIHEGVYRLFNIFNLCKTLDREKELKIINAKNEIKKIVDKRNQYFSSNERPIK